MRIKIVCLLIVLSLFIPAAAVFAKTWYVAPAGKDAGSSGSMTYPFRTITYAIGKMNQGDTCMIRGGIYREKIIIDRNGITLCAYPGEYVLVTGCDLVKTKIKTFRNPGNNQVCSRAKIGKKVYQLFIDGQQMDIARWPNSTTPRLSMQDWDSSRLDAAGEDKKVVIPAIPDKGTDFWKGGYYIGANDRGHTLATWFSSGGQVASSTGDTLHLNNVCYGMGKSHADGDGFGYILNCLNALDTAKEWFWAGGYLYFKPPAGIAAKKTAVEARTRLYILDITADQVKVEGLNFKAGAALIKGNNAAIERCTFRYTSPFVWNSGDNGAESGARCNWGDYSNGSSGICVLGNGFSMKDCYVAHSWFNGIVLWGNNCRIGNCIIEDIDWIGKRCSGINSYGADNIIRYCTIRNTGASSIEGGNGGWIGKYAIRNIWEHNRCENACRLVVDQGFFYVNHQSGAVPAANSEWRYNLLIHNQGPDKGQWSHTSVGLYVDNNSSGYRVHHNVVVDAKEGIHYNDTRDGKEAGKGVYFYNNTFYKVDRCMIYGCWGKPDAAVIVENNLGIMSKGYGDNKGRKTYDGSNVGMAAQGCVQDAENMDFRLKCPEYKDAGVLIPGIDLHFAGPAPDIGAYESGIAPWKAGATLKIPDFPDEK